MSNVVGTFNVLQASIKSKIKKFIYAASASCYGIPQKFPTSEKENIKPEYPYAFTKWQGEEIVMHWAKIYKFPAVSLRFFNIYGPRSRTSGAYGAVFGVFLAQKLFKFPLTIVGNGKQTRSFLYIDECLEGVRKLMDSDFMGPVNIGSEERVTINQLAQIVMDIGKKQLDINHVDGFIGVQGRNSDNNLIREKLGWEPTQKLSVGIEKTYKWIHEQVHK